ncbi:Cell division protein FtsL [Bhargavaea cecembensis DSE10]|uniref:Cell division protein FtsL n=1 Tax=Bhargavaea cecembensis DSE10 TaxID=1235279 RepID=M7P106_9BACL|nr:cell division protein FtsL [Bhargavaea cecembensis]EMR07605.1 Cell division protein FtsL [Bhargavaea cecembensis DSE10]
MALEARKFDHAYIQEPEITRVPAPAPEPEIQPKRSKKWFTKGEKTLFVAFVAAVAMFAVILLQAQSSLNEVNKEIQLIQSDITETAKQNHDLSIQVSEKSTYERIWGKARELGLSLNEKNVKVVPGQ